MTSTKIRPGLYRINNYTIEDYHQDGIGWLWRVEDTDNYSDPWIGDYKTKREAIEAIKNL